MANVFRAIRHAADIDETEYLLSITSAFNNINEITYSDIKL